MIAPMVRTKLDVKRRLRVVPISSDVIRREFIDELWVWLRLLNLFFDQVYTRPKEQCMHRYK